MLGLGQGLYKQGIEVGMEIGREAARKEAMILGLKLQGLTNAQIASKLNISVRKVKSVIRKYSSKV